MLASWNFYPISSSMEDKDLHMCLLHLVYRKGWFQWKINSMQTWAHIIFICVQKVCDNTLTEVIFRSNVCDPGWTPGHSPICNHIQTMALISSAVLTQCACTLQAIQCPQQTEPHPSPTVIAVLMEIYFLSLI